MPLDLSGIKRIRAGLSQAIDAGAKQGAAYIQDLGSQLAPYDPDGDSPHLNESIVVEPVASGVYNVIAGDGLGDPRADVQEHGSVNQDYAQPYMGPAAEAIDVSAEVAKQIKELVG